MDDTTQLYKDLSLILTTLGEVKAHEVDRKVSTYDDGRVILTGLWANSESGTTLKYEAIWCGLHLDEAHDYAVRFPKFGPGTTMVFEGNCGETLYVRNGRWKAHLTNLAVSMKLDRKQLAQMNETWVDDNRLFPDLD